MNLSSAGIGHRLEVVVALILQWPGFGGRETYIVYIYNTHSIFQIYIYI